MRLKGRTPCEMKNMVNKSKHLQFFLLSLLICYASSFSLF